MSESNIQTDAREQLLSMKNQIENAKIEESKLEGKIDTVTGQMTDQFKVDSIQKADEKLKKMDQDLGVREKSFNSAFSDLQGSYDWEQ